VHFFTHVGGHLKYHLTWNFFAMENYSHDQKKLKISKLN
jgi:hypothetical protein